jgi:iron complex transport system substrate-binding protein
MNHARPHRRRVAAIAVPIALIAAVLAGCGDSASSGTSTAAPSGSTGATTSLAGDGAAASTPASELNAAAGLDANGCITTFDPAADYYPVKSQIDYATNFTVEYDNSYQVLTVLQPTQGGSPQSYVLVKCGAPTPELTGDLAGATVVTTPVTSLYSGSTTHLPNLVALDRLDVLTGVASKSLISEKEVLDRVAEPGVVEYAAAGSVDAEAVVAGKPDVVITAGTDDPAYAVISAAGVPVLADAEWLENDPLGRAEWIKYFAALTGTEAQAAEQFDAVEQSYTALADKVASADPVQVVPGQPYQGTWYVPGGQSFNSRLIADAGGTTAWADDPSTGSVSTDLESVLAKAGKAPAWLASTTWTSKAEALAEEPRFSEFAAFQSGNVWNAAKDVTAEGGNNYYELGTARPDLVLGDLVAILHPDLMPGHDFAFYLQLS